MDAGRCSPPDGADRATGHSRFEGILGRGAAVVMAGMNRDMEGAAVDALDPARGARVLAVGFGPGVGVAELARRCQSGHVAGIDPSSVMVGHATRRNRRAVATGRVTLRRAGVEAILWPDASFDGVVAVNCVQLWDPLVLGVSEVARVLRLGGSLVVATHRWAIERSGPADCWVEAITGLLTKCGIDNSVRQQKFRSGPAIVIHGTRV